MQDNAEGVDVHALVEWLAVQQLRCHVVGSASRGVLSPKPQAIANETGTTSDSGTSETSGETCPVLRRVARIWRVRPSTGAHADLTRPKSQSLTAPSASNNRLWVFRSLTGQGVIKQVQCHPHGHTQNAPADIRMHAPVDDGRPPRVQVVHSAGHIDLHTTQPIPLSPFSTVFAAQIMPRAALTAMLMRSFTARCGPRCECSMLKTESSQSSMTKNMLGGWMHAPMTETIFGWSRRLPGGRGKCGVA
jgi:hypothetical protein